MEELRDVRRKVDDANVVVGACLSDLRIESEFQFDPYLASNQQPSQGFRSRRQPDECGPCFGLAVGLLRTRLKCSLLVPLRGQGGTRSGTQHEGEKGVSQE
jgi:hypothetical protein